MAAELRQVDAHQLIDALAMVAGAGRRDGAARSAGRALHDYLTGGAAGRWNCQWLVDAGQPVAAGLLTFAPGRSAVLLHSSTELGLVRPAHLAALADALAGEALRDAALVQALIEPGVDADADALSAAGFALLANLAYLRCDLPRRLPPADEPGATFIPYTDGSAELFEQTIAATYEQSLDCPALEGLRTMADTIAGHKGAGRFRPDLWTLALCDGEPAGVLLLNEVIGQPLAEVVYMGVVPRRRGQGLGERLLARAARQAVSAGLDGLTLAVDERNTPAHRLYERAGFVTTARRRVYIRSAGNE